MSDQQKEAQGKADQTKENIIFINVHNVHITS